MNILEEMSSLQRRSDGEMFDQSSVPSGVNPFNYILGIITPRYFIPLSKTATTFLIVFFIFHLFIAIFCLALLLLPYFRGIKRSQWLFRKLYIKDNTGANVYKSPLLWVNAGILMTASQLMGSLGAQAFTLIQLKSAYSATYAVHSQLEPSLGFMFLGEMLTYWSLMHCFLVAIYYDETHEDATKGLMRWTPSPTIINSIFLGFPICVVAIVITLFTWLCTAHRLYSTQAGEILDSLKQGASIWNQLNVTSTSVQNRIKLTTQLFQVTSEVYKLKENVSVHLDGLVYCFHVLQSVLLVLLCITYLIFMTMFGLLVHKYPRKLQQVGIRSSQTHVFRRWLNPKAFSEAKMDQTASTTPSLFEIAKRDRQFLHLLLRSLAMIVGMMTMMALFFLGIIRTRDVIRAPYWRGVAAWLATASGTWSAFPITWQCWRLYNEELNGSSQGSQSSQTSSAPIRVDHIPHPPWESAESVELEIKLSAQKIRTSPPIGLES